MSTTKSSKFLCLFRFAAAGWPAALKPPCWLLGYYLWDATLGELYRRRGDRDRAAAHLTRALDAAPTDAEKVLLRRRLEACSAYSDRAANI
jgi:predicted RNA polymerase sigma factor